MSMQKSYLMHIIMVFLKLFGTPPVFHLELILKERKTLKQVIKEINDHSFIQPYPSIYLNLKHVSEFRQNEFILEDNSIVPISRNRMKMCKESFYRFLNEV